MKNIKFISLPENIQTKFINLKKVAEKSITGKGHKVGCLLESTPNKNTFGVTLGRTRAIGSTCAERMALDQWVYNFPHSAAKIVYLIGNFQRPLWKADFICTPCGNCLEMFLEYCISMKVHNLNFICVNWNLTNAIKVGLHELFPQFGKGSWPYKLIE